MKTKFAWCIVFAAAAAAHAEPDGAALVGLVRAAFSSDVSVEITGSRLQLFNEETPDVVRAYLDAADDLRPVALPTPGEWRPQYERRAVWAGEQLLRIEERDRTLGGPVGRATAVWIWAPGRWAHAESLGASQARVAAYGPWDLTKEVDAIRRNITTYRFRAAQECFPEAAHYLSELLTALGDLEVVEARGFEGRTLLVRSKAVEFGMVVDEETGAMRAAVFPLLGGPRLIVVRYDGAIAGAMFPAAHPASSATFTIAKGTADFAAPQSGLVRWEVFESIKVIPKPGAGLFRWQSLSARAVETMTKTVWNADETTDEMATKRYRDGLAVQPGPALINPPASPNVPPSPAQPIAWVRVGLAVAGGVFLVGGVVLGIARRRAS